MAKYAELLFNLPASGSFTYLVPEEMDCQIGRRVQAPFGSRVLTGYVLSVHENKPEGGFKLKSLQRVIDKEPFFNNEHIDLAQWMAGMYFCSLGEALAAMLPGGKRESETTLFDEGEEYLPHTLSEEQSLSVEKILSGSEQYYYLSGITGSGKTEVYLKAAESTLSGGRGVIYLVPEISLTHQLIRSLKIRFGNRVAVLHSHLTPSQRFSQWSLIIRGEADLVLGARSAVFAPVRNLGLIILDEEHEGSYKSGLTPRYHARQVAMRRASAGGAKLVMGSATPSVEAYHLMTEGILSRLTLSKRLSGGILPTITVVDMRKEQRTISKLLEQEIRHTKERGKQSILFLNRRGFSYFFHCRSCGYEMKCRQCSVSLTYHKNRDKMICHYCGYTAKPVNVCPECGSLEVGYSGFGTEMIEEDARKLFPDFRIARIDTDTVTKRGSLQRILQEFEEGKTDLLLGTQMVAKGLNFPGVNLVGIVLADTALHLPDFRSAERTFALLTQVAGRAGRFDREGKVVIQTYKPENEVISMASLGDLEGFYHWELEMRKQMGFPPFTRLFRVLFRGKDREKTEREADNWSRKLESLGLEEEVLGPSEAPLSLISGNYRFHFILRSRNFGLTHAALGKILEGYKPPSGVYLEVDVDPVSLL